MSKTCRSKVVPCPAGDRCPQHKGMVANLNTAASTGDYNAFSRIKDKFKASREASKAKAIAEYKAMHEKDLENQRINAQAMGSGRVIAEASARSAKSPTSSQSPSSSNVDVPQTVSTFFNTGDF